MIAVTLPRDSVNLRRVALLVFGSGCCALMYQVAWLRLLRLVFGASTAASGAVLAIFLGGLGLGAAALGRRADSARNPLRLYARLELGVAVVTALSPFFIALVRSAYIALGGSLALGIVGGTAVRLLLSAVVLGLPTFLMGGTLPAVVCAAEYAADARRRNLGVLYGMTTLGAVAGALWTTFVSLERFGTRATIWSASALNLTVALAALGLAERLVVAAAAEVQDLRLSRAKAIVGAANRAQGAPLAGFPPTPPGDLITRRRGGDRRSLPPDAAVPVWLVLVASGVVGFAFLLMELVWYRMLTPLLGGTSYTFGLILAVALLGIGVGGFAYAAGWQRYRPTLTAFAVTCACEAFGIALPYAFGDRVAWFALAQRQGITAFAGFVRGWLLVTLGVVFPAAAVSGYQFPLLVGLLGSGERSVGEHVGWAYATNTLGAIVGALAGGFGLLPLLSAPGLWRAVVCLLAALAMAVLYAARGASEPRRVVPAIIAGVAAVALCAAQGPTAFWRQSGIGAGRVLATPADLNAFRAAVQQRQFEVLWEAEGVESSVALTRHNGIAFTVNGKADGNALGDAPTQIMLGLIPAILHSHPTRALVVGLGTGETAGWLAQVPSIEAVDVFELEPAILHVAAACALANQNVLANPKVHIVFGDARELLQTASATYDVIVSEPSNPYRAGTASLFTREFYEAVATRLAPGGAFVQWVQAYEVRADALRSVYATLGAVFPSVETWEMVLGQDLAFVARRKPVVHDLALVGERVGTEPYRSALAWVSSVGGIEGLYTGFVANGSFPAEFLRASAAPLNTDDRTVLEFEFARTLGQRQHVDAQTDLRDVAAAHGEDHPLLNNGTINWDMVNELRDVRALAEGSPRLLTVASDPAVNARALARRAYGGTAFAEARRQWFSQPEAPKTLGDLRMVAEILADGGDAQTMRYIEPLLSWQPAEGGALLALWLQRTGETAAAVNHLVEAFQTYRDHPWANRALLNRALDLAVQIADEHPEFAEPLFESLSEPFALRALDENRLQARVRIGLQPGLERLCIAALAPFEPNVPWNQPTLQRRYDCYSHFQSSLAARAQADLDAFLANAHR